MLLDLLLLKPDAEQSALDGRRAVVVQALALSPTRSAEGLRALAHVERDPRVRGRLLVLAYVQAGTRHLKAMSFWV